MDTSGKNVTKLLEWGHTNPATTDRDRKKATAI